MSDAIQALLGGSETFAALGKPPKPEKKPIEYLEPGSDEHTKLLEYLRRRLEASERAMSEFYPRWRVNERKVQAYVTLPDYERMIQDMNNKSLPPKVVTLVVPYSLAVIQTIVTYMLHTFCGRQPIFQVSCYNGEFAENARNLETLIQYNADHNRLVWRIHQALMNVEIYQVGIWRVSWAEEHKYRTTWRDVQRYGMMGMPIGVQKAVPTRERVKTYSGNLVESVDPFLFFPDPRVPMTEVARRGEFCFWRSYENRMQLRLMERDGVFHWTKHVGDQMPVNSFASGRDDSDRSLRSKGDGLAGTNTRTEQQIKNMVQLDEGTVLLVPADFGLSDSTVPEKWLFTIANKRQILRAEPFEADHDMHPVAVTEPNAIGNQFGSLATADVIGPIQDHISWLLNSHMQNVRTAINNRIVVNPHYVEMKDLRKNPDEDDSAWIIRMKQSAFGLKPSDGLFQMQVGDVTSSHIRDMETMIRTGLMIVGANENLMGLQDARGRKTATEVRTSGEAGASRLAAKAVVISSQGLSDLVQMMGSNLQQRMDPEFYQRVLGAKGLKAPLTPAGISGDFYYPMNDGTLPLDRAALLSVWQQILLGVAKDPELRRNYSLTKLFAYVADLGGARNIDSFKVVPMPDAQVQQQVQNGQLVPPPMQPA
jgi:hypothetical protein